MIFFNKIQPEGMERLHSHFSAWNISFQFLSDVISRFIAERQNKKYRRQDPFAEQTLNAADDRCRLAAPRARQHEQSFTIGID